MALDGFLWGLVELLRWTIVSYGGVNRRRRVVDILGKVFQSFLQICIQRISQLTSGGAPTTLLFGLTSYDMKRVRTQEKTSWTACRLRSLAKMIDGSNRY